MKHGKTDLKFRLSDAVRKGWNEKMIVDLVDSLWRDPFSWRTGGFHYEGGTDASLSFDNASRTLTIAPVGRKFAFYRFLTSLSLHKKYVAETIQIPNEEGLFMIYYTTDSDTKEQVLDYIKNPTRAEKETAYTAKCMVAFIYWNATSQSSIYFGDNRHGSYWNPWMHFAFHQTINSMRESGLVFSDLVVDGDGSQNTHAQFGIVGGRCFHDDFSFLGASVSAPADLPVFYNAESPRIHSSGHNSVVVTSRLCYNSGGAVLAAASGNFVMYHIFYTNCTLYPYISVMGNAQYTKVGDATLMIASEVAAAKLWLPQQNLLHIGTLIFQTSSGFSNQYHSRIVAQILEIKTQWTVIGDGSVAHPITLVNDEESPLAYYYYGTDGDRVKGWHRVAVLTVNSIVGDGSPEFPIQFVNDEDEPGPWRAYITDGNGVKRWYRIRRELVIPGSGSGEVPGSGSGEIPGSGSGEIPGGGSGEVPGSGEEEEEIPWVQTFLELLDTPDSYDGQGLKFVRVNAAETGLEFYEIPSDEDDFGIGDWIEDIAFDFNDVTAGTAQTYYLDVKASFTYTILSAVLQSDDTMDDVAIKINGTAVGGLGAIDVTTSLSDTDATSGNSVAVGDSITLVTSGTDGDPTLIRGKIRIQRT